LEGSDGNSFFEITRLGLSLKLSKSEEGRIPSTEWEVSKDAYSAIVGRTPNLLKVSPDPEGRPDVVSWENDDGVCRKIRGGGGDKGDVGLIIV